MASAANKERKLFFIIKQGVIDIYHHLGYAILVSVLWFIAFFPFAGITVAKLLNTLATHGHPLQLLLDFAVFGLPYAAFILGPVQTALFDQMDRVINGEAGRKGLWEGIRKYYWSAVGVYALFTGMLFFCVVDLIICFFVLDHFGLRFLGVFLFYLYLLLLFAALYLPGILVFQRNTVMKVIKKSLLLLMDNAWLTIGVFLSLVLVGVVCMLITPLLVLFFGSCLQVMMIHLFHGVMAKYADPVAPAPEECVR